MIERLEENMYYMKLCPRQNEEMVQIGALGLVESMYIMKTYVLILYNPLPGTQTMNPILLFSI
jgi:hypothetical protein